MTTGLAVLLGAVQGVTEFLPISSKTHLVVVPALLGETPPSLAFITLLHLGTLVALIAYFARHPDDLGRLEPRNFERLIESIFRNQGYDTEIGPGWNDGGVDLRFYSKDDVSSFLTLVQVKRWSKKRPIRLEAVAALAGLVENEGANRGLFVTTSRYLPSASRFARRSSRRLVLAQSDDVAQWCQSVISKLGDVGLTKDGNKS